MNEKKLTLVTELHKSARRNYPRRRVDVRGIDETWQADLVDMMSYAGQNKGYKYMLTVIDIFSNNFKASICERFDRTLRNKMWKRFSMQESYKWLDILSDLVSAYNNTKHRTIRMKPSDVTVANERLVLRDKVRTSKFENVFEKGYTPNWTTEIFTISQVENTNPVTYKLKDYQGQPIAGGFYEQELLKVEHPDIYLVEKVLQKRRKKLYVKWLGFDTTHNS
ncbi:uncharacterized protein LOC124413423 [Diprion similis]|uniref:uncharacterized protein LOC124413423 n=1 Tax=Diprion similis TaxID=362088 RepID=UPI001EF8A9D5|nr:uncharacterized protein LOC124413423 [Diprion similis]